MEERVLNRRGFFRETFLMAGKVAVEFTEGIYSEDDKGSSKTPQKEHLLRPPGAVGEDSFLELCTCCDECIKACPYRSIKRASQKDILGTPIILPRETPCYLCKGLPCIKACNTGALIPLDREEVRMGVALIDKSRCFAWDGQNCQFCLIKCPLAGDAIYMDDFRPVIREDRCTGCGVCEQVCSTINNSAPIRVIPLRYLKNTNSNLKDKEVRAC